MPSSRVPLHPVPGYPFEPYLDLSQLETRERLSQSAADGLFAILERWQLSAERAAELLGGMPQSSLSKLKSAAGIRPDEMTRISYMVGIYRALHSLLPSDLADCWMTRPNDNLLFAGGTPLEYVIRGGIPGLQRVRSLLDEACGGR